MSKQFVVKILCVTVLTIGLLPMKIYAEDFNDEDSWMTKCTDINNLNGDLKSSCQAFVLYLSNKSESLKDTLKKIDTDKQTTSLDIQSYQTKIDDYQSNIEKINNDISLIQTDIGNTESEIQSLKEKEKDLKAKVARQMEKSQGTMRINKMFDILFGTKTFASLLRIANGLRDITLYQNKVIDEYTQNQLAIEESQKELSVKQDSLQSKRIEALAEVYEAQLVQADYKAKYASLSESEKDTQNAQSSTNTDIDKLSKAQAEAERIAEIARQAAIQKAEEERKRQEELKRQQEEAKANNQPTPTLMAEDDDADTLPSVYVGSNAADIYVTLVTTYGFTKTAAVGIVANIQIESTFNPSAGSTYYGLCQWGGSRKTNLFNFLASNGYSTDSVAGQLAFMYQEMVGYNMVSTMNSFADSAQGASEAGVYFRQNFERSAGLDNVSNIAASYYAALG